MILINASKVYIQGYIDVFSGCVCSKKCAGSFKGWTDMFERLGDPPLLIL